MALQNAQDSQNGEISQQKISQRKRHVEEIHRIGALSIWCVRMESLEYLQETTIELTKAHHLNATLHKHPDSPMPTIFEVLYRLWDTKLYMKRFFRKHEE